LSVSLEKNRDDWTDQVYKRDPRLKTACSILIEPGYRRPMDTQEREWLKSFVSLASVGDTTPAQTLTELFSTRFEGGSGEFVRQPPVDQDNFLGQRGLSADGMALIVCSRHLQIIPVN